MDKSNYYGLSFLVSLLFLICLHPILFEQNTTIGNTGSILSFEIVQSIILLLTVIGFAKGSRQFTKSILVNESYTGRLAYDSIGYRFAVNNIKLFPSKRDSTILNSSAFIQKQSGIPQRISINSLSHSNILRGIETLKNQVWYLGERAIISKSSSFRSKTTLQRAHQEQTPASKWRSIIQINR